jgi:hypothetical protein
MAAISWQEVRDKIMFADLIKNYALPLFIPSMMQAVLDIIVENGQKLTALYLSDNNLCIPDNLSVLSTTLPNLHVLNIERNQAS